MADVPILSIASQQIPSLANNDCTRIEMACNQLRQSIALVNPEVPLYKSGYESTYTEYCSSLVKAKDDQQGCQIGNNKGNINGWTKSVYGKVIEIL